MEAIQEKLPYEILLSTEDVKIYKLLNGRE